MLRKCFNLFYVGPNHVNLTFQNSTVYDNVHAHINNHDPPFNSECTLASSCYKSSVTVSLEVVSLFSNGLLSLT